MMSDVNVIRIKPNMEMQLRLELFHDDMPEVPAGRKSWRNVKMQIESEHVNGLFKITSTKMSPNPFWYLVTLRPVES